MDGCVSLVVVCDIVILMYVCVGVVICVCV